MGYRHNQHMKLLLMHQRGNIHRPRRNAASGVYREARSDKLEAPFLGEMIRAAIEHLPKIELFCRSLYAPDKFGVKQSEAA